jgi:hypothetical protein
MPQNPDDPRRRGGISATVVEWRRRKWESDVSDAWRDEAARSERFLAICYARTRPF